MPLAQEGFRATVPTARIRAANDKPINPDATFVLYWMIAARRPTSNFALDRAVEWARELNRPLVVLESLRVDYPYASDRLHRFVIDGMADNVRTFAQSPALYYPYVEPEPGAAKGMLERLSTMAAVIVTDDFPCFFLPHAVASAATRVSVRLEAVDSNGLLPLAAVPQAYPAAVHHRRFMQRVLREHLAHVPATNPFAQGLPGRMPALPADIRAQWAPVSERLLSGDRASLAALPIDHDVPVVPTTGGAEAARKALHSFVRDRLSKYFQGHNHPDDRGTSRLSPYLHFGHISAHEVFAAVMKHDGWNLGKLAPKPSGVREGWWGVSEGPQAFLDQLVVWRELAFATCAKRPDDYDKFAGLPEWAQKTLLLHTTDRRPFLYDRLAFERAETHDPLWNAAQRELLRDGWMHNYMRMLWGKKILEWSSTPQEALHTMVSVMNRWALDGRDPNSYAGYMWTLGRYDRPWPERPIYGTIRSMSSDSAARKLRLSQYLTGGGLNFEG